VSENQPQIVRDVGEDPDFGGIVDAQTGFVTRSVLCAPMSVRGQRLGAIELMNKRGGGFFHIGDSRLLKALAASAALAVINTRLAAGMVEQERIRREVELAAEVQRAMLPTALPPGSPLHGVNVPARSVSGDFFDILPLPGNRYAFAIGDVSGKGVNAALLMAKTSSLFRCLAKTISSPGQLLALINQELCETGTTGMFVTRAAGLYNAQTGRVVVANAGHEPPLMHRPGEGFEEVDAEAPPLGISPDLVDGAVPERVLDLGRGCLYLFTDGVTEAPGRDGAMLGAKGAAAMFEALSVLPPVERLAAVTDALAPPGAALRDDLTLLLVEAAR
jgi:sigma-B regulation protein RsbU (phosphoserine phosphatase)